jgi:hypothetical protein
LATCTDSSATSRMISRSVSDSGAWRRYASAYVLLPCSAGTEVELVAEDRSARATDGHRAAWVDIEQLARLVPCRERSTAHMAAFWNDRHPRGWTRRAPWSVRHPRGLSGTRVGGLAALATVSGMAATLTTMAKSCGIRRDYPFT